MAQLPRCAASVKDIDDSDLHLHRHRHLNPPSSLLRRCTTSNQRSSHRRIPGLASASAVREAMRLRSPLSSVPAIRADGQTADADFLLDSWLGALRYLGELQLVATFSVKGFAFRVRKEISIRNSHMSKFSMEKGGQHFQMPVRVLLL